MWVDEVYGAHLERVILALFILFAARALIFGVGSLVWTENSSWVKKHLLYSKEKIPLSWSLDGWPALRTLLIDSVLVGFAIWAGWWVLLKESSWVQFLTTFVVYYFWMEAYFYYTHRWMHLPRWFWVHRFHHVRRATHGLTSLAFSVSERLVLIFGAVVLPGLFSQWIPFSGEAIGLYFLYNYVMNVYGHLNVEVLPSSLTEGRYGFLMSTTKSHSLHHQIFRGNYGLFTQIFDRLHGTAVSSPTKSNN